MASRWRLDLISGFKIHRNFSIRLIHMLAESGKHGDAQKLVQLG
jgi:hypothetical protein